MKIEKQMYAGKRSRPLLAFYISAMFEDSNATILYAADGGIARITLNRPEKRNALNDELIAGLKEALRQADHDEDVRVAVLSGAGSDFCSGADLAALQKISAATVAENIEDARSLMELFLLIRRVRTPVISAVRGRALTGGCGLALACDMVLAARSARFGFPGGPDRICPRDGDGDPPAQYF